ncbi:MAG: potassium transporter [Clostridiales bacterium]|nr:MAG: potassium transporter [Clostridiales bacterium]
MLFSLAIIFLFGMFLSKIFKNFKLPGLLGMLIAGILLGPYVFNLLDCKIIGISAELRQIALIIILAKAGINLDISELKKIGRPAILMCFVPASFEIIGIVIFAPKLLGISVLESVLLGTVLAAVSPAVIIPLMLKIKEQGYGTNKAIPQMIMAGASVDDVFVIILFTTFSGLLKTGEINVETLIQFPTSIILGLLGGIGAGLLLSCIFKKMHMKDSVKIIIILSLSFLFISFENILTSFIGFSGLLAVMALCATINIKNQVVSIRLSEKFSKLWIGAEIILFVLVGASINIQYAFNSGIVTVLVIFIGLVFRMGGVFICLIKTNLNIKEKLFTVISYAPKATVQAAIGGVPFAMGLSCGNIILTVAVVSILITSPVGAFFINKIYKKCLSPKQTE